MFDAQVLLDPFEEQLHLPAFFVERRDGGGRQREVVCQEHKLLAGFWIGKAHASQVQRVVFPRVKPVECDGLIGNNACGLIGGVRINTMKIHVALGARDKERSGLRPSAKQITTDYVEKLKQAALIPFEFGIVLMELQSNTSLKDSTIKEIANELNSYHGKSPETPKTS